MFDYQKSGRYFAQVPGLSEELCAEELNELGAEDVKTAYRGVYFNASAEILYKINYTSRLISRVLAPLISFQCYKEKILYSTSKNVEWDKIFGIDKTFAITATVSNSKINNSLYASQLLKDGIADYFRDKFGKRPNVDTKNPDVRLNLRIEKNKAVINLDTSGESLHKRGYRLTRSEAPMQETLAAAIIRLSVWNGDKPLWDPMCGSGTILCEALMHYCRIPAQFSREKFGFFCLPDFDQESWTKIKEECDKQVRPLPNGLITGSDTSQKAIAITENNLSRLPYSDKIELKRTKFQKVDKFENGILITNPPYGIRLGKTEDVKPLYSELGDFLKQKCSGTSAFIYMGDPQLRKSIGLKTSRRVPLVNGKLEGVLVQIDSYEGSKRKINPPADKQAE